MTNRMTFQYYPQPPQPQRRHQKRTARRLVVGAGVVGIAGVGAAGAQVYADHQHEVEQAKQAEIEQVLDPALVAAGQQITTAIENGVSMKSEVNDDGTVTFTGFDEDRDEATGTYDQSKVVATFKDGELVSVYVKNGMSSNGSSDVLTTAASAVMTAPDGHYDHEIGLEYRDGGWFGAATQSGIVGHGHNVSTGREGTTRWMGNQDPPTPAGAATEVATILDEQLKIALDELRD